MCLSDCPSGFYPDAGKNACEKCDSACIVCNGAGPNQCSHCANGFYKDPTQTSCSTSCPKGSYPYATDNTCGLCNKDCSTCAGSSASDCTACANHETIRQNTPGECRCKDGWYASATAPIQCAECHVSCKTCTGGSDANCLTCSATANQVGSKCECKEGYYRDKNKGTCMLCHNSCKACSDRTEKDCIKCHDFFYLENATSECLAISDGEFFNDSTGKLEKCADGCSKCLQSGCVTCSREEMAPDETGVCVFKPCTKGTFRSASMVGACTDCPSTCAACSSTTVCTECKDGSTLSANNTCECNESLIETKDGCAVSSSGPSATLTVNSSNELALSFDPKLKTPL